MSWNSPTQIPPGQKLNGTTGRFRIMCTRNDFTTVAYLLYVRWLARLWHDSIDGRRASEPSAAAPMLSWYNDQYFPSLLAASSNRHEAAVATIVCLSVSARCFGVAE